MVSHSVSVWEACCVEVGDGTVANTYAAGLSGGTRLLPHLPRTSAHLLKVPYLAEDGEMPYASVDRTFIKPAGANKLKQVPFVKSLKYSTFKRKQYFQPANTGCTGITFLTDICGTVAAGLTPQSYVWHWDSPDVGEYDAVGCVILDYTLDIKPDEFPFESMEFQYYDVVTSLYQDTALDYDDNQPNTFDDITLSIDANPQEYTNLTFHVKRNMNDERVGGRFQRARPYIINEEIDVKVKFRTDSDSILGTMKPVSGYHVVDVGGSKTGASATGLTAGGGAPGTYYFKINGVEYSIITAADVTYTAIIAKMNLVSFGAQWSLDSTGNLRCTSAISTGSITLTAGATGTDLFATLTGWVHFDTAVAASQAITTHSLVITIVTPAATKTLTLGVMTLDPEDITINKLPAEINLFEYEVTFKNGGATTKVLA
jgi:hypothetical protein